MQINYADIVPDSVASERDDSNLAKSLANWLSIQDDLARVIAIAERIEEILERDGPIDQLLLESMTWHLVLRYARCFDSSASGRATVLGAEAVRNLEGAEHAATHEGLIHRRKNTFAHAGSDCSCHMNVHLVEEPEGPRLQPTFDEEAPGPLNDPDQARAIAQLCAALRHVVAGKIAKANTAYSEFLAKNAEDTIRRLRANRGKHANLSQQALVLVSQLKTE